MKLTVKLLPPYRKKGDPGEYTLRLEDRSVNLKQLAFHINKEWKDKLAFDLIDQKELLTAEFIVNGTHAPLDYNLKDGDRVTIIPYICGG